MSRLAFYKGNIGKRLVVFSLLASATLTGVQAGPREQAKRIHDRLAGTPPSTSVLNAMEADIAADNAIAAAYRAMADSMFYSVTLKNLATPWTNEEQTVFAPLNDYTATFIGMVRDDLDIRQMLYGDIIYTGNAQGLPGYSNSNNNHYQEMEDRALDLQAVLQQSTQSSVTQLPAEATSGVLTTRTAGKSFMKDGTNRGHFRFTLMNHLCTDLEPLKDITRAADRIYRDVSRSPGGDSRIYTNSCYGCHAAMDPMNQAYAYYNFEYDVETDPEGNNGRLSYNQEGDIDPATNSRVKAKYHINKANFPYGYITQDDRWDNYWREGQNLNVGWDDALPGNGYGAKSLGQELAHSQAFAQCQVKKVFTNVCLREPVDQVDRDQINTMVDSLVANGFQLKRTFAESAVYCMGE